MVMPLCSQFKVARPIAANNNQTKIKLTNDMQAISSPNTANVIGQFGYLFFCDGRGNLKLTVLVICYIYIHMYHVTVM